MGLHQPEENHANGIPGLTDPRVITTSKPMDSVHCDLPTSCVLPVLKSPRDYQAYRISPEDTNRLALVFDPTVANMSLTYCVEIFDIGGKTPPNRHQIAVEMFFILKGEGRAICDGKTVPPESRRQYFSTAEWYPCD
jgi:hypothetical protein